MLAGLTLADRLSDGGGVSELLGELVVLGIQSIEGLGLHERSDDLASRLSQALVSDSVGAEALVA